MLDRCARYIQWKIPAYGAPAIISVKYDAPSVTRVAGWFDTFCRRAHMHHIDLNIGIQTVQPWLMASLRRKTVRLLFATFICACIICSGSAMLSLHSGAVQHKTNAQIRDTTFCVCPDRIRSFEHAKRCFFVRTSIMIFEQHHTKKLHAASTFVFCCCCFSSAVFVLCTRKPQTKTFLCATFFSAQAALQYFNSPIC